MFDPRKNPAMRYCDTVLALARDNGRVAGRIAGIVNRRHNESSGQQTARFGFLECIDDREVVHGLLSFVEGWADSHGMRRLVGPMGFTDLDPEGLLVDGFEEEPSIGSFMNSPFVPGLIEQCGYNTEVDYVVYSVPVGDQNPLVYEAVHRRLARQGTFRLLEFKSRSELKPYASTIFALVNENFQGLYGFAPLDDAEVDALTRAYLPVMDPRFVKLVASGTEIAGFILGIPNMNSGFRTARGRLWPTGVVSILMSARRSKRLDLLLGAIKPQYRGLGLDVLLGRAMVMSAREAGMTTIDSHHELESNVKMRREMERAGGRIYKRFRIYGKDLEGGLRQ
jgi:hypothetical protein